MYLSHFGLKHEPFSLTPDTDFAYQHAGFSDALETLQVAIQNGEGFIKITGEVGTGKTMLCRWILNHPAENVIFVYIHNPILTPNALNLAFAHELGLNCPRNAGQHRVLEAINEKLLELVGEEKRVVVCIDEAQSMPAETLEALRLLTNLETEKRKLLQVILFGQPELDERLAQKNLRQLRQRITFSYTLPLLDYYAAHYYIAHRLAVAGFSGGALFQLDALKLLSKHSRGVPRLINILSHKVMMLAYGTGKHQITKRMVMDAIADTEDAKLKSGFSYLSPILASLGIIVGGYGLWSLVQYLQLLIGQGTIL